MLHIRYIYFCHYICSETHERETYKVFPTFLSPNCNLQPAVSLLIFISQSSNWYHYKVCALLCWIQLQPIWLVLLFICQRAECTTCLPVKSTILSTASQPWYGYSSSKLRWSKGYCIHNTLRCGCCLRDKHCLSMCCGPTHARGKIVSLKSRGSAAPEGL